MIYKNTLKILTLPYADVLLHCWMTLNEMMKYWMNGIIFYEISHLFEKYVKPYGSICLSINDVNDNDDDDDDYYYGVFISVA